MQKHKLNKILLYIALSTTMLPSALAIPIYTTALGITGSGKGELNKPDRITTDSQGKIYVSDSNNRVAIWNAQDNSWVGSFGSEGSGVGNFLLPSGIALNNRDKIYVVDDNNHRVTVWNAQNNSWVGSFGSEGSGDGKIKHPTGIALDSQGKIYVVDSENNRISIWNTQDNSWVGSFGSEGSGYGKLNRASGIALDSQGKIYVADSNNDRILIWNTQDNSWVGSFGSEGSGDGKIKHPTGIALDSQGKVYVADSENNRISIWNTQDNSWVGSFGSEGSGYGKLRHPNDIGVYQSMVYVTDYNNNRATIWFDPVLWKSAGTVILGTLNLNQDLKLDQDYNLQINKINDTTYNGGKSDGKLTITDKAVLTANAGSSINATSIVLDDATLILNTESISGNITYSAEGTLNINANITNNIDFAGKDGLLQLADSQTITGNVDSSTSSAGTLEFLGKGTVTGTIGGTNALSKLKFSGAGDITIPQGNAETIEVANKDTVITASKALTANILFSSNGRLISDKGITGNVDFAGKDGLLQLADSQTITGNVDSSTSSAGTLEFLGRGTVTGTIGGTNALSKLKFSGAGDITIPQGNAETIEVANKDTVITASKALTANILFSSNGRLISDKGITGNVDFAGKDGLLQLADSQTITGNVDSSTSSAGTLEFLGRGTVTGTIGGTNALSKLKFSGAGDITIPQGNAETIEVANKDTVITASKALTANILFSSNGRLISDKGITGNVDFAGKDGLLQLADSQTITGNVDSSTSSAGTLEFLGKGTVTGTIGGTNALSKLKFSGAGDITIPQGNAETIEVANKDTVITASKALTANILFSSNGRLISDKGITGNVDFAGKDGLLQLADSQTITGNVDSSTSSAGTLEFLGKGTVTGTIGGTNALSKLKFSGAGDITIPQGNAETIEVANKDTVITASKALTANILFSSNGRLISDKGITGNVDFAGKDGLLQLADSQTITGNVDSSTSSAGTLEFLGKGTVTGTIGGTNALSKLKFSGAGDITIPQGNAETIEVANKDTVITASKALTANILFSSNGRLISDKGITGNVDFAGKDGLLQLADSQTITGNVDSSTSSAGTLEFLGRGTVTGTIGGTNALSKLKFSGAGDITIPQGNAETIEVANKDTVITASKALTANILFSSNGRLISDKGITGNVDFAGKDGLLQLADSQTITGNVDSSTSSAGTLEFLGKGTVTGTIGGTNALSKLKFSGAGDITIPQGNAETIEVANKDTVITASKALTANILFSSNGRLISDKGITGNVDFAGKAAKLVFDRNISDDWYKLDGVISNASSAILEVDTKLKVVDKGVGTIKTINIGQNGILSIKSNEDNLSLISSAGGSINLIDKDAQLVLSAAKNQTIKFNNNIKGADNGGGIILFDGNGSNLTITASDNVSLGTDDKKLGTINISGNVIFDKNVSTNASNLSIGSGGFLTNYSSTTSIDNINIGNSSGSGEYILDSRDEDLKISTGNIVYKNEDSILALINTSEGEERTITLDASIVPSQDKYGILTLYSKGDKKFTIDNNNDNSITFGTKDYRLKGIKISSDGDAEIDIKPEINVESIGLDLNKIDLGQVDANIVFYKSTKYNANGDINGSIDFQGNKGVINVGDNVNISSTISSTGSSGEEITFLGSSTIGGVISNISTMRAGAGDITLQASGDYSIGELQGNGSGAITFPSGMNFTGGINRTGGNPLNLSFADSTNITGDIGSSSSAVGNISSGNNTQFNGDINSSGDIKTSGKTLFSGDVSCNNIIANRTSSSMLSLSLTTLTSAFNASSGNMLDFDESSVVTKFQGQVSTNGNIELNGSTYFASSVESQGNIVINGDTKFNKTLSNSNNIAISSNTNVIFNGNVKASSISIDNASIAISDDIEVQGNISTNNSTIILDNNKLTLSGTNSFSDHITISSTYDESSLSGGNIVLQSGSTLDLSNVSELTIKLAFINSDISKVNDDIKYNIILAEDGSKIVLLSNPEKNIKLDSSGEQNKFVKWTLDANSLTLYASDDSNNIIDNDYRFDSKQENDFMKELKESPPGSNGSEFKNNIGLLSKEQVEEMFSRILDHPKERSSDIVRVAVQQSLSNAHKTAMHAIHNRLGQSAVIVSAGEEDVSQYGVWLRTSINKSHDKVSSKRSEYFSSYKTRGHNHTIGFDGLVCDGLVVGGAYTRAYTNIRPQNQNIGNTDKVRTNMFSLYSAYNIPNYSWYLDSTLSYAESFIKNKELRNIAVSKNVLGTEIASSKYKSYLYSGSLSLGYIHNIGNNINIIPSLGALGSVIRDKGYAESGTSFQNLIVGKKSYNKLSGNVGIRISQHIYLDDIDNVILIPEIYGFANYNIKNKTPAIDARLSGINDRLPTISFRSNRIDYNIGLGVTIKQNMMEYGINYDANLAKKYQGHSGSIKVRVNL